MLIVIESPETTSGRRQLHGHGCRTLKAMEDYVSFCQSKGVMAWLVPDDFDFGQPVPSTRPPGNP